MLIPVIGNIRKGINSPWIYLRKGLDMMILVLGVKNYSELLSI